MLTAVNWKEMNAMVAVRVGTGSLDDFDVMIDENWPVVPRVGESIIIDPANASPTSHVVREVAYLVGRDDLIIGVMLLV